MAKTPATLKPSKNEMATTQSTATTGATAATAPAAADAAKGTPTAEEALATAGQAASAEQQANAETAGGEVAPALPPSAQAAAARTDKTKHAYVVGMVPVRHDGEFYDVGYEIELTTAEADRLSGLVVPLPATPKE